jgi:hypothetical protein
VCIALREDILSYLQLHPDRQSLARQPRRHTRRLRASSVAGVKASVSINMGNTRPLVKRPGAESSAKILRSTSSNPGQKLFLDWHHGRPARASTRRQANNDQGPRTGALDALLRAWCPLLVAVEAETTALEFVPRGSLETSRSIKGLISSHLISLFPQRGPPARPNPTIYIILRSNSIFTFVYFRYLI